VDLRSHAPDLLHTEVAAKAAQARYVRMKCGLTHRSLGLLLALLGTLSLCSAQGGTAPVLQRCSVASWCQLPPACAAAASCAAARQQGRLPSPRGHAAVHCACRSAVALAPLLEEPCTIMQKVAGHDIHMKLI
jgi:hypothetical protein